MEGNRNGRREGAPRDGGETAGALADARADLSQEEAREPLMHLNDVERTLRDQGFLLDRVRGSHRHYQDPARRQVTLACHTGKGGLSWRVLTRSE